MFLPCLLHCDYLFDICLLFKLTFILILFTRISRNYMLTANVARECGLINPSSYQVVQNRVTTYNKKYIICVASRAVAREGAGGGGMPPPLIPFAPDANFRNLAHLEEVLEKMQWCFHIRLFWHAKLLRVIKTDHLTHVRSLAFSLLSSSVQTQSTHFETLGEETLHRNTGGRDCPNKHWGKALDNIVTGIPANAFTININ